MKLDINKLNEAVEKAFDKIFENGEKKEKKEVKPTQWHDDYSNKEEGNVVQTRINPDTKKPEFKIPTNDKVYDTRDAAIAALKESKKGTSMKKTIRMNESELKNIIIESVKRYINETSENDLQKYKEMLFFNNISSSYYNQLSAPEKEEMWYNYYSFISGKYVTRK